MYNILTIFLKISHRKSIAKMSQLNFFYKLSSGKFEVAHGLASLFRTKKASVSLLLRRPNKRSRRFLQLYSFLGFGLIKNGIDFGTQPSLFLLLWNLHVCAIMFRASGHLWKKNYSFSCLRICCENVELLVSVGDFLVSVLVLKKTWHNYFWRVI